MLTRTQLPWSTCNEDLIDLFSTIGKVDRAEIQYEPNGRSRGTGVVQFDTPDTAETAIGVFPFIIAAAKLQILIFISHSQVLRLPVRWSSSGHHLREVHERRPGSRRDDGRPRVHRRSDPGPDHVKQLRPCFT